MKNSVWLVGVVSPALALCCLAADPRIADLRSAAPTVRAQAAKALAQSSGREAGPALIDALRDRSEEVRREAAAALGALKDARAVNGLCVALADPATNVRLQAAYALGEIKAPAAAAALLGALRDPQWAVRDQAAWALRELGDRSLLAPLCAALNEPDADMPHLLWLIRHLGGAQAAESLAALLATPQAHVRERAVRGLVELRNPAAAEALGKALHDDQAAIRRAAVEGLLALGNEHAEEPLTDLLRREPDPTLRKFVQQSVARMSKQETLAAHWSFDDRSTQTARDMTGHGNDGAIRGCTPTAGKIGAALQFGKGKFIELGKPAGLPLADKPFTVMAWVQMAAPNGVVVARGGAYCGYALYIKDGRPKFGIRTLRDDGPYIAAGREPLGNAWTHLAGVVCSDRVELYVNGRLAATAKSRGYFRGNCGQGMQIGVDAGNSAVEITDAFDGSIDELKIFHAELTAKDLARECR